MNLNDELLASLATALVKLLADRTPLRAQSEERQPQSQPLDEEPKRRSIPAPAPNMAALPPMSATRTKKYRNRSLLREDRAHVKREILKLIETGPVSRQEIAEVLKIEPALVTTLLREIRQAGHIQMHGTRATATYTAIRYRGAHHAA